MKILLLGDVHYGVRNDNPAFLDNTKRFLHNLLFPYMNENNIKTLIQVGDLFDRRKYININTANRFYTDFLMPCLDNDIDLHVTLGNHDVMYKSTNKINCLSELCRNYPLNIYDKATEVMFDGLKILLVPWICDDNKEHSFKLIKETNAQICFGHLELQGFEMFKGSIISHGEDPELFSRFDLVGSGHFHHRSTRGNIYYLGSPAEYTWSDYNDPRGFHIFDTETRQLTFIENPYKMFHKIWYNDGDKKFLSTEIDYSEFKGKIIKVIIQEKNNPYWFDKFVENIEKQNPVDIQIVEDHLNLGLEEDQDIVNEAESTIDIFKRYIENTDAKGINKLKLEQKIVDLYHEALTIA